MTFSLLLLCIGGGTAILLWLSNIRVRTSSADQVALWLVFEGVCGLSYLLSRKYFSMAVLFLLAGLWLCNAFSPWYFSLPIFLYLFALLSLFATGLSPRPVSFLFALSSA